MSQADYWKEKEAKKQERENARLQRILASPLSQGAYMSMSESLMRNVASVAAGLEALELLLVQKGILADDELMQRIAKLMEEKADQAEAQQAVAPESNLIVGV